MKSTKIKDKITGKVGVAFYITTLTGNLRYAVNGKTYSDKEFDKKYEIVKEEKLLNP